MKNSAVSDPLVFLITKFLSTSLRRSLVLLSSIPVSKHYRGVLKERMTQIRTIHFGEFVNARTVQVAQDPEDRGERRGTGDVVAICAERQKH